MALSRKKLYNILIIACFAGYVWLYFNLSSNLVDKSNEIGVCLIKQVTTIPCPSCGSTRSVLSLFSGNLKQAIYWNPFGIILVLMMIITPFWILYDSLTKKETLLKAYLKTETILRNRNIALPLVLIVIINWIWNIYKGL
ncbi:MAG: DUF2752 domain-containing protein [Paludibacter sp.]